MSRGTIGLIISIVKKKDFIVRIATRKTNRAFTIVEVIVVVIIIALLAALTIVGYNSVTHQAADVEVKNDLQNIASAMELAKNANGGEYPTSLPNTYEASEGVQLAYYEGDAYGYCIEARSLRFDDVAYFYNSANGTDVVAGTCGGGPVYDSLYTAFVYDTTAENCVGTTVQLPISSPSSGGTIDWGDGTTESMSEARQDHTYAEPGEYTVLYEGPISQIIASGVSSDAKPCLIKVSQWGDDAEPTRLSFGGSTNLDYVAPPPSSVTSLQDLFASCTNFNAPLAHWDISNVTTIRGAFYHAESFNKNINSWDVSNVTSMRDTFNGATVYNQPLDQWDTGSLTDMSGIFRAAKAFNQNIDSWDVSGASSFYTLFWGATDFNQPLNSWDTSNVTDMSHAFRDADSFNQDLDNWDTGQVQSFGQMFNNADVFNGDVSTWDTSSADDMNIMFARAYAFNQPLNSWDVSGVTKMRSMFERTEAFNQPLNNWDTSSVTNMNYMFVRATAYNQDLSSWDVSNVTGYTSFSQYASSWTEPQPNFN